MPFFAPAYGTIARRVKAKVPAKICFLCHNIVAHESRPGDKILTRYALSAADFFVVQSGVVEEQLVRFFPKPIYKRIPHPVYDIFGKQIEKNDARRRLGLSDERIILFFGYVRAYKGLDLLFQSMPAVLTELPVRLLVVGEFYEDESIYRNMLKEMGLTDSVTIIADFVPSDTVNQYFCAADVVVLPYKTATQSGIVQLAYHFDKPCIVTDVGGLAEVVIDGKTGMVVAAENPSALARAILKFYREGKEAEFAANVEREKGKYSWERMTEGILALAAGTGASTS
jgi:glycosyltransferase involved in cell wall biosynthesis